jgi:multicomponent Na+:H+ antiporter subunit E
MIHFAFNLVLAIVWMLLRSDFSLGGLLVGFLIGFLAIAFARVDRGSSRYVRATIGIIRLTVGFLGELVVSNLQLARDLLRPRPPFRPGFVRFPIGDLRPPQTVLLANLVSLTPGTVTVDIREDGRELLVHSLYAGDPEAVRRSMRRLADLIHAALGAEAPTTPRSPP